MYTTSKVGEYQRAIMRDGVFVALAESTAAAREIVDGMNRPTVSPPLAAIKALVEKLREDEITWKSDAMTRAGMIRALDGILAGDPNFDPRIMLTVESALGGFAQREVTPGYTLHGFFSDTNASVAVRVEWL